MKQLSTPEHCSQCFKAGKISKLILVNYRRDEAYSTCENKQCTYFLTDAQGNPIKFKFSEKEARLIPVVPVLEQETHNETQDLDVFFQTLENTSNPQTFSRTRPSNINMTVQAQTKLSNNPPTTEILDLSELENEKISSTKNSDDYFDTESFLKDFLQ